ncbi:CD63 antigen-like [Genypterus blacodes]|uniref:CD63 antigen-like n=1 Tax=Genypterus blacodes TaxID=154954 RepID=UPI003F774FEF
MGLERGMKRLKFLLFFFNFLFWIFGLSLMIVGIMFQVICRDTLIFCDPAASPLQLAVIVVGVAIVFVAFFGCCGAWKENFCMVTTFAILLFLIIIVEIAVGFIIWRGNTETRDLRETIFKYNNNSSVLKAVNQMQENLKCCGVNGSADWKYFKPDEKSVPDSCCVNVTTGCGAGTLAEPQKVHQKGCSHALEELQKKDLSWVIVAALGIVFLQTMGIVFACLFMRGLRSGYEVM